jgi:hypothetical protein
VGGLIGMNNEIYEEGGQFYVKRGGEVVKDSKSSSPSPPRMLSAWIDERKLGKVVDADPPGGRPRPGTPPGGGGKTTFAQAKEYIEEQGGILPVTRREPTSTSRPKTTPTFSNSSPGFFYGYWNDSPRVSTRGFFMHKKPRPKLAGEHHLRKRLLTAISEK